MIGDTIILRGNDFFLEVASEKNQIKELRLFVPETSLPDKKSRRIILDYTECKKYLQTLFDNSLKQNKIDRLEAVWFDFENRNKQLSMIQALEKHLYKGFRPNKKGEYRRIRSL